jgi:hypothetical protein
LNSTPIFARIGAKKVFRWRAGGGGGGGGGADDEKKRSAAASA